jgi:uncharacterized phage protein (TIGR01671 family)
MREIKFRVWEKEENVMHRWDEIKECADFSDVEDESGIWMQYTGLKDKNGKEIYEGDIVLLDIPANEELEMDEIKLIGYIAYEPSKFSIIAEKESVYFSKDDCECIEILGNIYENPELLK